jgi:hypothetical protein
MSAIEPVIMIYVFSMDVSLSFHVVLLMIEIIIKDEGSYSSDSAVELLLADGFIDDNVLISPHGDVSLRIELGRSLGEDISCSFLLFVARELNNT